MTTTPLTPEKWLEILRAEGVKVAEFPGWRTNERDQATGKPFGPVYMILNHHTAATASLNVVAKGRSGLPGPLAHAHLNKRGLVTMVSAGRANHAGLMAKNAFESFVEEDDRHPKPDASTGTVDGNDRSYGIEVENLGDGEDTYTREQYDAWVRFDAAVARHHLWTENSAAMHSETSVEGKIDPKGPVEGYGARGRFTFSGNQFRQDVAERLRHPASWNPGESEAPVTDAERKNPTYSAVVEADAIPAPRNHPDTSANPFWTMESYLRFIAESLIRIEAKLK